MTLEFESVSKSGMGQVLLYNLLDAHGAVALEKPCTVLGMPVPFLKFH